MPPSPWRKSEDKQPLNPLSSTTSSSSSSSSSSLSSPSSSNPQLSYSDLHKIYKPALIFFLLGLQNNSSYVIMIAAAKQISEGGVALVFLANILPCLLCKVSGPYWYHLVSYKTRISVCAILMSLSFLFVGYGDTKNLKLLGVILTSIQSGVGEATILSLCSRYDNPTRLITAWSSGTGLAGVFGFAFKVVLHDWFGFSFGTTLALANVIVVGYVCAFRSLPAIEDDVGTGTGGREVLIDDLECENNEDSESLIDDTVMSSDSRNELQQSTKSAPAAAPIVNCNTTSIKHQTPKQKLRFIISLYPYMVPLFFVYFAEYACQSGNWAAIGFPVDDERARERFYTLANWMYQIGVFCSRSSGTYLSASPSQLYIMPVLQVSLLIFFYLVAEYKFWYNMSLLAPCFMVGLLGGFVYVNAFTLISKNVPKHQVEFALSAASMADSFGILLATGVGLVLQGCLYESNGIEGAVVSCPL